MTPFAKVFASMFDRQPHDDNMAARRALHREWDRQRANALTPSDRAEIDAIFSRSL
jgi:hypothetical protein